MRIDFYKNTFITSDYNDVFDVISEEGRNEFEEYLSNQSRYLGRVIYSDFYVQNNGTFNIEFSPLNTSLMIKDINSFTYMKISGVSDIRDRYYFIESAEYWNDMITVNYTLDYWHTYAMDLWIDVCHISRKRYLSRTSCLIPTPVPSNKPPYYKSIYYIDYSEIINGKEIDYYKLDSYENIKNMGKSKFCVISSVQVYGSDDFGKETPRESYLMLAKKGNNFAFDYDEATNIINEFEIGRTGTAKSIYFNIDIGYEYVYYNSYVISGMDSVYYELMRFYIIPYHTIYRIINSSVVDNGNPSIYNNLTITRGKNESGGSYFPDTLYLIKLNPTYGTYNGTILLEDNYRFVTKFGVMNNMVDAIPVFDTLSTLIQFTLLINFDSNEVTINLCTQSQSIDITSAFDYESLITSQSGESVAIAKQSRILGTVGSVVDIISGATSFISTAQINEIKQPMNILNNYSRSLGYDQRRKTTRKIRKIGQVTAGMENEILDISTQASGVGFLSNVYNSVSNIIKLNSPNYTTNSSNNVINNPLTTKYGLCVLLREINDGEQYQSMKDIIGEGCDYIEKEKNGFILDSNYIRDYNVRYDYVKMEILKYTNTLPSNVTEILLEILTNGVRIHYRNEGL